MPDSFPDWKQGPRSGGYVIKVQSEKFEEDAEEILDKNSKLRKAKWNDKLIGSRFIHFQWDSSIASSWRFQDK